MRFYCPSTLNLNSTLELPDSVCQHLKVLRLQPNTPIELFNGDGFSYTAQILTVQKKSTQACILKQTPIATESPLYLHLAVVLSKGDRLDWILQKATELGVQRISLLTSERCEVRLHDAERLERKMHHWQQVIISACEQCGRCQIPQLDAPLSFSCFLDQSKNLNTKKLIMDPKANNGLAQLLPEHLGFTVLSGPEGGFSTQETAAAQEHGFTAIRLGPRILRTETAPLTFLSLLQLRFGDLG